MSIKLILDEISNESSTNQKMVILSKYKDNELLKRVIYLAHSKRVKFYIKQIPEPGSWLNHYSLEEALKMLEPIMNREYTGYSASEHLAKILCGLSSDDAYVIERIIDKDLKIGMSGNINKVFPKLIEETPYMGAKPFDIKLAKDLFKGGKSVYCDVKMDGRYNNAIIRNGEVELESRQGEPVLLDAQFTHELMEFPDCVLNGELTIDGIERYKANGIIRSLVDITSKMNGRSDVENDKRICAFEEENNMSWRDALDSIVYTVWDMITVDEYFDQKSDRPYEERWSNLQYTLHNQCASMVREVEKIEAKTYEEALINFQLNLERGLEGSILKAKDGKWKNGKPITQVKMKLEIDLDLLIADFNWGTKGTKNENVISSLRCCSSDGLLWTNPSGMTESLMQKITDNQEEWLGKIITVTCSGLTKDVNGNYATLHPRVGAKMYRDDKTVADSLEDIINIENAAKGLNNMDEIWKVYFYIKKNCSLPVARLNYTTQIGNKLNPFNNITVNLSNDSYNAKLMENAYKEPGFLFFNNSEEGIKFWTEHEMTIITPNE